MKNTSLIFCGGFAGAGARGAFCNNKKGAIMKSYLIFYRTSTGIKYYTGKGFAGGFSNAWHFTLENARVAFRELKSELNIFNLDIMVVE